MRRMYVRYYKSNRKWQPRGSLVRHPLLCQPSASGRRAKQHVQEMTGEEGVRT